MAGDWEKGGDARKIESFLRILRDNDVARLVEEGRQVALTVSFADGRAPQGVRAEEEMVIYYVSHNESTATITFKFSVNDKNPITCPLGDFESMGF